MHLRVSFLHLRVPDGKVRVSGRKLVAEEVGPGREKGFRVIAGWTRVDRVDTLVVLARRWCACEKDPAATAAGPQGPLLQRTKHAHERDHCGSGVKGCDHEVPARMKADGASYI